MKKRCKRKVWSTNINPIAHAIAGAAVSDKQSLDKLRLCELSAIDAMTKGMGTTEDWRWLADVINIAETMGKAGIGPEVLPYCQKNYGFVRCWHQSYKKCVGVSRPSTHQHPTVRIRKDDS